VRDTDTVSTEGYYITGVGQHRACRISDISRDSEEETDKSLQMGIYDGVKPIFHNVVLEAADIRRLTGALTG
jgi:hypothetical protein